MLNRNLYRSRGHLLPVLGLSLWLALGSSAAPQQAKAQETEKVSITKTEFSGVFSEKILWSGTGAPVEKETAALTEAIKVFQTVGRDAGIDALENFVSGRPTSGWTPSVRANLGKFYRDNGRYTRALKHWEAAWNAIGNRTEGPAKRVGDFTLAHWTSLLASLGQKDLIGRIYEQTKGRNLDGAELQQLFNSTRDGHFKMQTVPGSSYRCGTYALSEVVLVLYPKKQISRTITSIPSPATGFTVSDLLHIAKTNGVEVVAARRLNGDDIVVPSVVHLKQNHYAAIVAEKKGLYYVIDPTFGRPLWMKKSVLNEEASGVFLAVEDSIPKNWRKLNHEEALKTFGKGAPNNCHDQDDCGKQNSNGDGASCSCSSGECPIPCDEEFEYLPDDKEPGKKEPPPSMMAMPRWWISEPYISLWMGDTPMTYRSSNGRNVNLTLKYKQRESRAYDTNFFNFGPQWNCNWLSYLKVTDPTSDPNYENYDATLYLAGGGERRYLWSDSQPDSLARTRLERVLDGSSNILGFKLYYPSGQTATYGYIQTNLVGDAYVFLTERHGRNGVKMLGMNYESTNSVLRLTGLVDSDGQTNIIRYSTNFFSQVSEVENPFGNKALLKYDSTGRLTNITDVINLSSSFTYDTNGWITALTTPYGTTSFQHVVNSVGGYDMGGEDVVNRAILVTHPNTAKELYLYCDNTTKLASIFPDEMLPEFPSEFSADPPEGPYKFWPQNLFLDGRNTYYWGPRQFALLSTTNIDIASYTTNDINRARIRHWNHNGSHVVGQTLGYQINPHPTGAALGAMTWYNDYYILGRPSTYGRRLPDGSHEVGWMQYDDFGNLITSQIAYWGYTNIYGYPEPVTYEIRQDSYVYAENGIDLLRHIGPDTVVHEAYGYDTNHQVLFFTNAVNYVTSYTYNTNGNLTSIVTPAGLTMTNLFDSNGWLVKTIDLEIYRTNMFTWTNGLLHSQVNECGLATTNTYDALGRWTSRIYPDGTTISNMYTLLDVTGTKDRLGNWTYRGYDPMRKLTAVTNALGNVTRYSYCVCGSLESVTNALNQGTTFTYDGAGRRTAVIDAGANATGYSYDTLGRLLYVTDAMNHRTTNYYDYRGRIVAVSNALGRLKAVNYNIEDLPTTVVDANGVSINMTYDNMHRLMSKTYPDTGVERYGYSAQGLIAYTNQLNKVTRIGYDNAGRKTSETNANAEVINCTYNPSGVLLALTDGKNQTTTWNYDEYCRVTNKIDALTNVLFVYKYDVSGRLTNRWSAAKGNTYYAYDALGSLTNVDYPTSTDIQMQYDVLQRLTNIVDAVGTTKYAYTSVGQLQSEDGPWADDTVNYSYTANRLRSGISLPGSNERTWQQTYTYDAGNRLDETTSNAGTFDYVHKSGASALVQELRLPGGSKIVNTYDGNARLTNTTLQNSSAAVLNEHAYTYNVGNQRIKEAITEGNYVDYTYDDIGQLKTSIGYESGGSTARLQEHMGYAYDAAGNLNWRTNNALLQDFNVNALNQLTTVGRSGTYTVAGKTANGVPPVSVMVNSQSASVYGDLTFAKAGFSLADGTNTFTVVANDNASQSATNAVQVYLPVTANYQYDDNGNLLSDGRIRMEYDDNNQLISISATNKWKSEFIYDAKLMRRIRREYSWSGTIWNLTNEIRYIYSKGLVLQERNSDNLPIVTYTRGEDMGGGFQRAGGIGGLLARSDHLTASNKVSVNAFYHTDGNGNITALVNQQQILVARYCYDPYGNLLSKSGVSADLNLYRFSSKEQHINSGYIYFGYRYYSPTTQRWINGDPVAESGGINLFRFNRNNSIQRIDYFGLRSEAPDYSQEGWNNTGVICKAGVCTFYYSQWGDVSVQTIAGNPYEITYKIYLFWDNCKCIQRTERAVLKDVLTKTTTERWTYSEVHSEGQVTQGAVVYDPIIQDVLRTFFQNLYYLDMVVGIPEDKCSGYLYDYPVNVSSEPAIITDEVFE